MDYNDSDAVNYSHYGLSLNEFITKYYLVDSKIKKSSKKRE
jgi:hypothetical protein